MIMTCTSLEGPGYEARPALNTLATSLILVVYMYVAMHNVAQ